MTLKVAYQGEPGANSHIACLEVYPDCEPLSCGTFEDAFQAVKDGEAQLAISLNLIESTRPPPTGS